MHYKLSLAKRQRTNHRYFCSSCFDQSVCLVPTLYTIVLLICPPITFVQLFHCNPFSYNHWSLRPFTLIACSQSDQLLHSSNLFYSLSVLNLYSTSSLYFCKYNPVLSEVTKKRRSMFYQYSNNYSSICFLFFLKRTPKKTLLLYELDNCLSAPAFSAWPSWTRASLSTNGVDHMAYYWAVSINIHLYITGTI